MLVLEVWTRFWISKMSLLNRLTFFLENWTSAAKNKYTCGRFNRWINTVFQINSKNVGRQTESGLSHPSLFYRSEGSSKLRHAQRKLFLSGGTFRLIWVSQPIASVSINESWMFKYYIVVFSIRDTSPQDFSMMTLVGWRWTSSIRNHRATNTVHGGQFHLSKFNCDQQKKVQKSF